jgi:hypothetical protein
MELAPPTDTQRGRVPQFFKTCLKLNWLQRSNRWSWKGRVRWTVRSPNDAPSRTAVSRASGFKNRSDIPWARSYIVTSSRCVRYLSLRVKHTIIIIAPVITCKTLTNTECRHWVLTFPASCSWSTDFELAPEGRLTSLRSVVYSLSLFWNSTAIQVTTTSLHILLNSHPFPRTTVYNSCS